MKCEAALSKLCCDGVLEAAGVAGAAVVVAGCAGVSCPRSLELTAAPSLIWISNLFDLPPLAVGVLCVVREPDAAGVAAEPPGVVAALLISDPVCEANLRVAQK